MKKIDLHIHTIPTMSDSHFDFNLDSFRAYVSHTKLDLVAITNHDVFDKAQYQVIRDSLGIAVFPGIEINCENGHLLVISEPGSEDDFSERCFKVTEKIQKIGDKISFEQLRSIFGDLNNYIIIPHYEKGPAINGDALRNLSAYIDAGEVDSAKKFVRNLKVDGGLTPALFSDVRISSDLVIFPTRQTFIDCGDISLKAVKSCLRDRAKVFLSAGEGNKLYQVLDDGTKISTGLNVLLGERSSGKTYALDNIYRQNLNVKYIRQFELVQRDSSADERRFTEDIERRRGIFVDNYLQEYKQVVDGMITIDQKASERKLDSFLESLLKSAQEHERHDAFSKCRVFSEASFGLENNQTLKALIESVIQIIENIEHRDVIQRHISRKSAAALAMELIELLWRKEQERKVRVLVNGLINDIKAKLSLKTSATQIKEIDLYEHLLEQHRISKFNALTTALQVKQTIYSDPVQSFTVTATKNRFERAQELKAITGQQKLSFSGSLKSYTNPYDFLQSLKEMPGLADQDYYRHFVRIEYKICNKDGSEVSGGERSEFRLLQEIKDAQNFDLLLIDEPESSFDNLFLRGQLNQIIKDIAGTMPVIIVTHNSTVGASIKPNYILYAQKERREGVVTYRMYAGYPTDKKLIATDGQHIANYTATINALEAGQDTYEERAATYENLKD